MRFARVLVAALLAIFALAAHAKIASFGYNPYYNLGFGYPNNTRVSSAAESVVTSAITVSSVAVGGKHVLLVSDANKAYAYGYNYYGQLGFGNSSCNYGYANEYGCAYAGQVGDGSASIKAVAAGYEFSLALTTAGNVTAFGRNYYGQLGDNSETDRNSPVEVPTQEAIASIACGYQHSLALSESGKVYSWGYNYNGQLGDGTTASKKSPVAVETTLMNATVKAIAAGYDHSVALDESGQVWTWGSNFYHQLGKDGSWMSTPHLVNTSTVPGTVVAVAAGKYFTLLLTDAGAVYGFGYNGNGQLGFESNTTEFSTPVAADTTGVLNNAKIVSIAAGYDHVLALSDAGVTYSWGYNGYGQLGDASETTRQVPVAVYADTGVLHGAKVLSVHAGDSFSVLVVEGGNVPDSASTAPASLLVMLAAMIAALAMLL